ncbi:Transposase DDE domain protein [Limihaloglobus sulfuriphilus]|uniref:Transposase DDE domain protein n=1 Tax=Limihaloglobus sulfuriphilus TaxID=1851148 RepID=A0A1Q2MCW6_9BACT|nr:transposase [Limihaloglobus sulfuriphilus]AQQ70092.1 Transposase DDE domain protein [Limihaloglobus sulfuriphilus]AQQ70309.1 Transposase DDE domain protein [Limihaloglobus sulfuriphilus]AQQ70510.1 Transposase DDE domain protein [Limihaloglobus sulfuriphilus]AQQ70761.1 Transposase DDE domain protein [Limihaloglobus sulfuriphilus]AQQ70991.1 Transposase DDE domain protein [Limihaloglobus sulfuriphilus]
MANIPQPSLFCYQNVENLGDLERLDLLLKTLDDEQLMQTLEKRRGNGRDDYPIRASWNSMLAGIVFGHNTIEALRRELSRNGQLRDICGFDPLKEHPVPSSNAYTNLLKSLMEYPAEVAGIFQNLLECLARELPGFGQRIAIDSKVIQSAANSGSENKPDGRRDTDGGWATKTYTDKNGKIIKKTTIFGYKVHLAVDANYELPIARIVTPGNDNDMLEAYNLVDACPSKALEKCEYLSADKGYDCGDFKLWLWKEHDIRAVVDTRNMTQLEHSPVEGLDRIYYNQQGEVFCKCCKGGELNKMCNRGFEKDRDSIKFGCPAHHQGLTCPASGSCPIGKSIRIGLEKDPRIFMALPRDSYKWKDEYKKRTSVERVNSRLDVSFGFETHYIRGLKKMQMRVDLALITMLGTALGYVKTKQPHYIRSLVKSESIKISAA